MIYKFYPSTSTHIVWNQCHDFDFSIRNNADDGYRGIQAITRYRLDYVQFHELSDFLQWLKQYGISYSKDPLQIELPVKCDFLYDLVRKARPVIQNGVILGYLQEKF